MKHDCGSCSVCCFLMAVPDIAKPACVWCEHALRPHGGCGVYDSPEKPAACTDFRCLWLASQDRRRSDQMSPDLRPDRSHAMFYDARDEEEPDTLYLHVFPSDPGAWQRPQVRAHLDMVLARGCTVHVIIGYRRIILKQGEEPVSREDGAAARTALRRVA